MDNTDKHINAVWCVNSETGEEVLIDRETNAIVAVKDKDGVIKDVDRKGLGT
jgi:hypothetical protein